MELPASRHWLVLGVVSGYLAIVAYGAVSGNPDASVISTFYIGFVLLAGGLFVLSRQSPAGRPEPPLDETLTFLLAAGLLSYVGLSAFVAVPTPGPLSILADVVLLVAVCLSFYRHGVTTARVTAPE